MRLASLFILFLAFSQISLNLCGTISRSHRYKRTRITKGIPSENKWYQFLLGIFFGMAGQAKNINSLDKCVPEDWKAVNTTPPKIDEDLKDKTKFEEVVSVVKKIVDFTCKFKSIIFKFVGGRKVLRRRRYRMFTETGVTTRGIFSHIINKIDDKLSSGLDKVKDLKGHTWGYVKPLLENAVIIIKGIAEQFSATIKKYLTKENFDKLKKFIDCATPVIKVVKGLADIVTGITSKILLISSIAGHNYPAIIKLVVDLICNYPLFIEAYKYFRQSLEATEPLKIFSLVGKFLGTGFRALVK